MAGVYFSSSTNSTKFTSCCGVAICDDEKNCPECGEEVYCPNGRHYHATNRLSAPPQRFLTRREKLELFLEE